MTRHLIAAAIMLFFAVMMTFLVRDQIIPRWEYGDSTHVSNAQIADVWSGTDEWNRLYLNGQEIGVLNQSAKQLDDGGFLTTMMVNVRAGWIQAKLESVATLNPQLQLDQIRLALDTGGQDKTLELAGRTDQHNLFLRLSSPTGTKYTQLALKTPITLNITADAFMKNVAMEQGKSYLMDIYDPIWRSQAGKMSVTKIGEEEIEVDGKMVRAMQIEATMSNMRSRIWIDEKQEPVKREIEMFTSRLPRKDSPRVNAAPRINLVMIRITDLEELNQLKKSLDEPEPPRYEYDELKGENTGEPLEAFGLLPMLIKNQMNSLKQNNGDKE